MRYPVELICQRTPPTPEVEAEVFDAIQQLEGYCDHITGCQVLVRGPSASASGYTVSLKLRTPDAEMTIAGGRRNAPERCSLKLALREAFAQAAYELRMLDLPLCSCRGATTTLHA